ncbi:hypothetical protein LguiA_004738 [Lonicera macranthoides]
MKVTEAGPSFDTSPMIVKSWTIEGSTQTFPDVENPFQTLGRHDWHTYPTLHLGSRTCLEISSSQTMRDTWT